jgi:predicted nucleic acid-binding protein
MRLVLDASTALAWCIARADPEEAALAQKSFLFVSQNRTLVPALWYTEVLNTLLVFERAKRLSQQSTAGFLADIATLWIDQDAVTSSQSQQRVLNTARTHNLTAYDATYLELSLRTASTLATFDRKLAEAARKASVPVFGDTP